MPKWVLGLIFYEFVNSGNSTITEWSTNSQSKFKPTICLTLSFLTRQYRTSRRIKNDRLICLWGRNSFRTQNIFLSVKCQAVTWNYCQKQFKLLACPIFVFHTWLVMSKKFKTSVILYHSIFHNVSHLCAIANKYGCTWSTLLKLKRQKADRNITYVEQWGDCNTPQTTTWNKHKSNISIMFYTLFFTIWGLTVALLITSSHCALFLCNGSMALNWRTSLTTCLSWSTNS